ncbi:ABC transporter transmembrane domain-containing protein [Tianweitania sp.]|uniref:ABC transporter transmembrane domain-containing protein n=1 Tax=Tianweitania sp. TaxID=2021634 RepID=UPI0028991EED|nr:ABC transporter transmembrane domain-containing protein [Tianweitania sp.]
MAAQEPSPDARRRSLAPLSRLLPYLKRYRGLVGGAIVSLIIAAVTTLTLPIAVRRMIDHGFNGVEAGMIQGYFGMLIGIAAVLAAASALRYYFVITIGERVVADLRRDVFAHVTTLSSAFFDTARSGEIVSRLTADATQIKSVVGSTASQALRNAIMAIGGVVMMVVTSPKLSLMVLGAIPVIVLILVGFGRNVRAKSRHAQDMLAEASAYAGEQISAVRTLQAFTNEGMVVGRFGAAVDRAFEAARSSILARSILTFFAIFFIFSSVVAVLWFGSRDVLTGAITAGTLSQFLLYAVLAAGALGSLSEVWGEISQAAGAAERMSDILDEVPQVTTPAQSQPLPAKPLGAIEFRQVSFAYPARPDMPTLTDLSFAVRPGETVAIVGPSGSGKSTIFSLLMRFYDPLEGSITIDGVPLTRADPLDLRARMAVVPQDVAIFADTAGDNIAFGKPGASRDAIEAAARDALADTFIGNLEHGYDTQVGERGIMLSGGQRQRIGIARAILRDAPILLLDEATSALDAESETLVQTALERLMKGRTTLVIAHRLATILKADRILVLDGGRIVEEGTHHTLVQKNGVYAKLARLQFERGADAFQAAE